MFKFSFPPKISLTIRIINYAEERRENCYAALSRRESALRKVRLTIPMLITAVTNRRAIFSVKAAS